MSLLAPGDGSPLRGLCVEYLCSTFVDEVIAAGFDRGAKIYTIEEAVIRGRGASLICPRDRRIGAAYVDCVSDCVAGRASVMLSYTWGDSVGDIADGLAEYCKNQQLDAKETYVWICCLCINQHRVKEAQTLGSTVSFDDFLQTFQSKVREIGTTVALMASWHSPLYITRCWCVLELFTTIESHCTLVITMPAAQAEDMRKAVLTGELERLWKVFDSLKVENALASVAEDRTCILQLIKASSGFDTVNHKCAEFLRDWVLATCEAHLAQQRLSGDTEATAQAGGAVGELLRNFGRMERAAEVLLEAKEVRERMGTLQTLGGAVLLQNLGAIMYRRDQGSGGDFTQAAAYFEEAKAVCCAIGSLETNIGPKILLSLGSTRRDMGDYSGALSEYEHALRIRTEAGTLLTTSEGARLLNSIGGLRLKQEDARGALVEFEMARQVLVQLGTYAMPDGARLLMNMGKARNALGDVEQAVKLWQEAKEIHESTGTIDLPGAKHVLSLLKDAPSSLSC